MHILRFLLGNAVFLQVQYTKKHSPCPKGSWQGVWFLASVGDTPASLFSTCCQGRWGGGQPENQHHANSATKSCCRIPLKCYDFTIESWQFLEASHQHGDITSGYSLKVASQHRPEPAVFPPSPPPPSPNGQPNLPRGLRRGTYCKPSWGPIEGESGL